MKYIVVDLEMNPISKKHWNDLGRRGQEIIEIGAVALNERFQEVDSFSLFVKPQFNDRIESKIEKLTGITTEMVADAPDFSDAIFEFFKWCDKQNDRLTICQWSENDLEQINRELLMKDYILTEHEMELLTEWHDIQQEYGEMIGMGKRVSLEKALYYGGIDFNGKQHDALYDARNTAVLFGTIRNEEQRSEHFDVVIAAMKPQTTGTFTLGDIFDLKSLFGELQTA